jgi:hypothetical protein
MRRRRKARQQEQRHSDHSDGRPDDGAGQAIAVESTGDPSFPASTRDMHDDDRPSARMRGGICARKPGRVIDL